VRGFKLDLVVESSFLTAASFLLTATAILKLFLAGFAALAGSNGLYYFDLSVLGGGSATTPGLFLRRRHNLLENLVERGLGYVS
jgi:hypothetical protein